MGSEHAVVGRQYLELRAAVDLVGYGGIVGREGVYVFLCECVALLELRVEAGEFFVMVFGRDFP